MKLNNKILKEMIRDVLRESDAAVGSQELRMQAMAGAKEMSSLSQRERKVIAALQNIQKALSAEGEQASQKVVALVQRLMDELEAGQDISAEQGGTR